MVGGGGEWHSELRLEKLVQKMIVGSHFCCEDVLMQKNCTNNSVPFQKDIPFLRQLLSDIIIINEIPFQIELFSYF